MKPILVKIGIAIFIISAFLFTEIYMFKKMPLSYEKKEKIIYIKPGSSISRVSNLLEAEGIITNARYFNLYVRWHNASKKIKSGELRFYTNAKPNEVLNILTKGHPVLYPITIPEGLNLYQIADKLVENNLINKEAFIEACFDAPFLESLNINGPSVEGYLFPDTYNFSKYFGEKKIIKAMVDRFFEIYLKEFGEREKEARMTRKEIMTLASIVEKETGAPEERPLISAVFRNRLKKGMKLQSDPTVIYGIWKTFNGNLTKNNLLDRTPYNTYAIYGLPLGPIASPGLESLKAVFYPAKVDYIYFVSKNDGTHYFSTNLKDHNKAVNVYQKR